MTKMKDEITRAIGDIREAEKNTWAKIQQPPKKNRKPIFVSIGSLGVIILLMLIIFNPEIGNVSNPKNGEQNQPIETIEEDRKRIDNRSIGHANRLPMYLHTNESFVLAEREEDYQYYSELFQIDQKSIDFSRSNVVFAIYTSDGCGHFFEGLFSEEQSVTVKLLRPLELRGKGEYACTTILQPFVEVIEIDKTQINQVYFQYDQNEKMEVKINELVIIDQIYDFNPLFEEMHYTVMARKLELDFTNEITDTEQAQNITNLLLRAVKVPGIADMAKPQYMLHFTNDLGSELTVYLWFSEEDHSVTVMSSRNTNHIYTLPSEQGSQLLEAIGFES